MNAKANSTQSKQPSKVELADTPSSDTLVIRLINFVLGTDPKQRATINVLFLTGLVFIALMYVMLYGASKKIFDSYHIEIVIVSWVASTLVFYFIFRTGWNLRFSEKSLAMPQTLVAQTVIVYSYAYTGVAHACALMLLALVMVFGMFNMKVGAAYLASIYTITLLGFTMLYKSITDSVIYSARIEWIYFVIVVTVLLATAQLSAKFNAMREQLKLQKVNLEVALANIQEMATHDELTGLSNRRYLMTLLKQHVELQARVNLDFFVAMIDLDYFKNVNDSHGHAVGDEVLINFSKFTCEVLRKTDIVGRWGGEEFLLIMPETLKDQALNGISRLHVGLKNFQVSESKPELRITFSAGLTRHRDNESIDLTLERADKLLYAAKLAGRNQTVQG